MQQSFGQKMLAHSLRLPVFLLVKVGLYTLAGFFVAIGTKLCARSREPSDNLQDRADSRERPVRLLFLSIHEFRGEQYAFTDAGILGSEVDPIVQQQLIRTLYPEVSTNKEFFRFVENADRKLLAKRRRALRKVLSVLYRRHEIDIVIGHDHRVWFNFDWGEVSESLGVPYVIIYRETALFDRGSFNESVRRHRTLPKFRGSAILVSNKVAEKMFSMTNTVAQGEVHRVGNPRMDSFVKIVTTPGFVPSLQRGAVLFSGAYRCWISGGTGWEYMDRMHIGFARAASRNPNIVFTMKFKAGHQSSDYFAHLIQVLEGESLRNLDNLRFEFERPAIELVLHARLVVGILSTTILESGLAGQHVILPVFKEYQASEDWLDFGLKDYLHLFHSVETDGEYLDAIENGVIGPIVPTDMIMEERRALFEEFVSNLDGSATAQSEKVLREVLRRSSSSVGAELAFTGSQKRS